MKLATQVILGLSLVALIMVLCDAGRTLYLLVERPLNECGTLPPPKSIPHELVVLVLAQEDVRFFDHDGIDFRQLRNALRANMSKGKIAYGASTIDMQVVSLCYLKDRGYNGWREKGYELILVAMLRRMYSQEEILRAYFGVVPLIPDSSDRGFVHAAWHYYNRSLADLTSYQLSRLTLALRNKETLNPKSPRLAMPRSVRAHWGRTRERARDMNEKIGAKISLFDFISSQ